ncbi:hypothetical protein NDI49_19360 [Trichocoleus sp. ST-U3]
MVFGFIVAYGSESDRALLQHPHACRLFAIASASALVSGLREDGAITPLRQSTISLKQTSIEGLAKS